MPINLATCDKCREKIEPKDQYAITHKGEILCLECGQAKPHFVLAWRTAIKHEHEAPQKKEKKKGKK